jgi:hypothetical protein
MLQRKKTQPGSEGWRLQNLCYLIAQLDSIRAFKRVDLTPVEESFREVDRTELWDEIQPDLEKIVYFPQTLPGALKLMQVAAVLRRLFPLCFFSIVLVILTRAGFIPIRISPIAFFLLLFLPFAILIAFIYIDLFIRRTIIRYEREHPNMQSKQKEHVRTAVQKLIPFLIEEVRNINENPIDCKMKLFYDDYEGMKIVKEIKGKLFNRKYPTYLAIPSMTD